MQPDAFHMRGKAALVSGEVCINSSRPGVLHKEDADTSMGVERRTWEAEKYN